MAKEIKAIECPKCGSTQKTEIRTDFYLCDSCQTEYFLDNDDINVNIRQNSPPPSSAQSILEGYSKMRKEGYSKIRNAFLFIVAVMIGLGILSNIIKAIFKKSTPDPVYTVSEGAQTADPEEKEEKVSWGSSKFTCFTTDKDMPVIVQVGKKEWGSPIDDDERNGTYVGFFDPIEKKEVGSEKLMKSAGFATSTDVDLRTFSNGKIYVTLNKNKIYQVDASTYTVKDVSVDLFKSQAALSAGVATMEFVYENYGDGLSIMTNDGKNFYYYPVVNKLYTKDQFDNARGGYKTVLPGAKDRYLYMFTSSSDDYPNEKIQLLKILYKDNMGGPKDMISHAAWFQDYGAGLHYDNDPYTKTLINEWNREESRIRSFTDLTPGRLYFGGDVLYSDDKGELIIKFYPDANPTTNPSIQSLDANTGAIKWTYAATAKVSFYNVSKYKDGYLFVNNNEVLMLDKSGKPTSEYKQD